MYVDVFLGMGSVFHTYLWYRICMYIYIIHTYVHIYICTYIRIYVRRFMYVHVHVQFDKGCNCKLYLHHFRIEQLENRQDMTW